MELSDENASVVKAAASQLTKGIERIEWSLDRIKGLSKRLYESKMRNGDAELLETIQKEIDDSLKKIREISQARSLMYWKLRRIQWPHGEIWKPSVGERLIGQVIQNIDHLNKKFVIIQKEQGELVTVFLSHADLLEKFERLKPIIAKRIVIERLPNHGRKYKYFVAVIPWSSKVA